MFWWCFDKVTEKIVLGRVRALYLTSSEKQLSYAKCATAVDEGSRGNLSSLDRKHLIEPWVRSCEHFYSSKKMNARVRKTKLLLSVLHIYICVCVICIYSPDRWSSKTRCRLLFEMWHENRRRRRRWNLQRIDKSITITDTGSFSLFCFSSENRFLKAL